MPPAEKKDNGENKDIANGAKEKDTENVIILDWDDTILCSSSLSSRGYRLDTPLERPCLANGNGSQMTPEATLLDLQLRAIEQVAVTLLTLALAAAPNAVHIITNAETGWVQLSAQKFIPGVVPLLSKVKILSARSTYESLFPDAPLKWKLSAIQDKILKNIPENKEKNVLSIGDSHVEREAVRAATKIMARTRTKTVKFAERPSMEQLRRELELISLCFPALISYESDLDLQLTVTFTDPTPGNYTLGSATSPSVLLTSSFAPLSPTSASAIGSVPVLPSPPLSPLTPSPSTPATPTSIPVGSSSVGVVSSSCHTSNSSSQPLSGQSKWNKEEEMVSS